MKTKNKFLITEGDRNKQLFLFFLLIITASVAFFLKKETFAVLIILFSFIGAILYLYYNKHIIFHSLKTRNKLYLFFNVNTLGTINFILIGILYDLFTQYWYYYFLVFNLYFISTLLILSGFYDFKYKLKS